MSLRHFLPLIGTLCLAPALLGQPVVKGTRPVEAKPAALEVSIAVPLQDGQRRIVAGPGQHFHVVLTNRSDKPLRLWSSNCSAGYRNLSFEIATDRGTWPIKRMERNWTSNVLSAVELQPGEHWVLEVAFQPGAWELPWDMAGSERQVKMRTIYETEATDLAKGKGVWAGKVTSAWSEYTIRGGR